METKNTILARQKEMQLSLEKVKHLIRLIQAFNFNQALAETGGKAVSPRVQDSADTAPEASSVEKVKAGSSSASSNTDGDDKPEEQGAAGNNQTTAAAGGDDDSPAVLDDSSVLAADKSPDAGAGLKAEPDVGAAAGGGGDTGTGLQAEAAPKPETEAPPMVDTPASSAVVTVATTNGTAEPACADHSPAGGCAANATNATNATTNSENKMAAVNPPETAVEKKQEEITDSDGSNNNNNSKTSEPSQHSLPALVSSLDNKK